MMTFPGLPATEKDGRLEARQAESNARQAAEARIPEPEVQSKLAPQSAVTLESARLRQLEGRTFADIPCASFHGRGPRWCCCLFVSQAAALSARSALETWAQSHSFAAQGRAYVGVAAGRRCAVLTMYRREGRTEYAFEGFALLAQLTNYSNGGLRLQNRPRTHEAALRLLDSGFEALLRTYCPNS